MLNRNPLSCWNSLDSGHSDNRKFVQVYLLHIVHSIDVHMRICMCTYVWSQSKGHKLCSLLDYFEWILSQCQFPAINHVPSVLSKFQPPCDRGQSFQRRSQPWRHFMLTLPHRGCPNNFDTLFILSLEQHWKNCITLHLCVSCCQSQQNSISKKKHIELHQLRHAMGHQSIRRKGLGVLSALSFHSGGGLQAEMKKSATANGMRHFYASTLTQMQWERMTTTFEVKTSSSRHAALSSLPMYRRW